MQRSSAIAPAPEEQVVEPQPLEQFLGEASDHRGVFGPQHPADHRHLDAGDVHQVLRGHQAVGEDRERHRIEADAARQLQHRRSGIEKERAMRRELFEGGLGDRPLGGEVLLLAMLERDLDPGAVGDTGAAAGPDDHPLRFERDQIPADRRDRRPDRIRDVLHRRCAVSIKQLADFKKAIVFHTRSSRMLREVSQPRASIIVNHLFDLL